MSTPADIIRFPKTKASKHLRLIDCQGEGRTMSALNGSVKLLNPGMDIDEIRRLESARVRARDARDARNMIAEGFERLVENTSLDEAHNWLGRWLNGKGKAS